MKKIISLLLCITLLISLTACGNMYNDYSNRLDNALNIIKVPVAKVDISENQVINHDMIDMIDFDKSKLNDDIITNISQISGKKAITNISKGSTFSPKSIEN